MDFDNCPLVSLVIGHAIAVHRALGPGLLESVYEACLAFRLRRAGIRFSRQVALPVTFEEVMIPGSYRADIIVDDMILIELKSVERLLPIHSAQMLTYLKLSGLRYGLLMNFNVEVLKHGLRSFVNPAVESPQ